MLAPADCSAPGGLQREATSSRKSNTLFNAVLLQEGSRNEGSIPLRHLTHLPYAGCSFKEQTEMAAGNDC